MNQVNIFTDGSVNHKGKVGYGAYLLASDLDQPIESLQGSVSVKRFESTSSTKLELQALLWALNEIASTEHRNANLNIYTDCQNIIGLPNRRARLEAKNYLTSKNKHLNNHELYQAFYRITSELKCVFIKVAGHQVSRRKGKVDRLFELVDRASRKALRDNSMPENVDITAE